MYLADYHIHSNASPDSQFGMIEMAEKAISLGLSEICFTDHLECGEVCEEWQNRKRPFDGSYYAEQLNLAEEFCRGKIVMKRGIELGQWLQNRERAEHFLDMLELDFTICSLHSPKGYEDMYFLDYDRADLNQVMVDYVKEIYEMALDRTLAFDCVGHYNLPYRYACLKGKTATFDHCMDIVRATFKALAERGAGIEANTSGYRIAMNEPVPNLEFLKLFRELGGEIVTVGSDGHNPDQIGTFIKEGQEALKAAGFKYFAVFEKHKPKMIKL